MLKRAWLHRFPSVERFAQVALAISCTFSAASQTAAPREKILAYFEATGVLESIEHNVELTADELKRLYPSMPTAFWGDPAFASALLKLRQDMTDSFVQAAAANLTERELDELLEFLQSDQGKRVLALQLRLAPLYERAAVQPQQRFNDAFIRLYERHAL